MKATRLIALVLATASVGAFAAQNYNSEAGPGFNDNLTSNTTRAQVHAEAVQAAKEASQYHKIAEIIGIESSSQLAPSTRSRAEVKAEAAQMAHQTKQFSEVSYY